jgi:hypothetical protein
MDRKIFRKITGIVVLAAALAFASAAWCDDDPLKNLAVKTAGFFKPLDFRVLKVEGVPGSTGANITIDAGAGTGIVAGMRLDIFDEGKVFRHPVTREPLGRFEKRTGTVEVDSVGDSSASASLLSGEAAKGSIARVTKSRIRALFYQDESIEWFLGDAYFRQLKDTGRFELFDTSVISDKPEELLAEARRLGADVLIFAGAQKLQDKTILKERLYWASDGREFHSSETTVTVEYAKSLKFTSGAPFASGGEPVLSYILKGDYNLIAVGDLPGDGKAGIIVDAGDRITVYDPAAELRKLWELKTSPSAEHIYLDAADVNGDGRDEIIFTEVYEKTKVQSYVYALEGGDFKLLWKTKGYLRVVSENNNKKLLQQDYLPNGGYDGPVREVAYNGSFAPGNAIKNLPPGINIYDFAVIKLSEKGVFLFYYDRENRLNVTDEKGVRLWTSKDNMGGFSRAFFTEGSNSPFYRWRVSDKLYGAGGEVLAVRRVPLTKLMATPVFTGAKVIDYWWNGAGMEEVVLLDDIKGSVMDMAVTGDKLYILVKPLLGFSGSNLLKGENPRIVRLLVYSRKM